MQCHFQPSPTRRYSFPRSSPVIGHSTPNCDASSRDLSHDSDPCGSTKCSTPDTFPLPFPTTHDTPTTSTLVNCELKLPPQTNEIKSTKDTLSRQDDSVP